MKRKWHEFGPFTVFDLETTGMSAVKDRIVEIAALRIETDGFCTEYQSLVNPGRAIPFTAQRIHGINDDMVMDAPPFKDAAFQLLDLAKGSTLVAHNARFDLAFIQESLARSGMRQWQGKTLDSLKLIKQAYKGLPSYSLQNLRRTFQLDDPFEDMQAHRAAADVQWTCQILQIAMEALLNNEAV